ncbi:hypothetical protein BC834DRAFT_128510 [Gloeopeniophorella convolvens]|nr:hypothetical protein BC834DRAFT_128510 [Gloeopeniophorella convolvens]
MAIGLRVPCAVPTQPAAHHHQKFDADSWRRCKAVAVRSTGRALPLWCHQPCAIRPRAMHIDQAFPLSSLILHFYYRFQQEIMSTTRISPGIQTDAAGFLTRSQRSRLIKSTRKLAKILGETPLLHVTPPSPRLPPIRARSMNAESMALERSRTPIVDATRKFARAAPEPLHVVSRRDSDSDNDSILSSASAPASANTLTRRRDWPPVLRFKAKSDAESEVDYRASTISSTSSSIQSPTAPSFRQRSSSILPSTPLSLIFSPTDWEKRKQEREARNRRKRLSKLNRYLGESIPPDLIIPTTRPSRPNRWILRRSHSLSAIGPLVLPPLATQPEAPLFQQEAPPVLESPPSPSQALRSIAPTAMGQFKEPGERAPSFDSDIGAVPPRWPVQRNRHSQSGFPIPRSRDHPVLARADTYFEVDDHPEIEDDDQDEERSMNAQADIPPRSESRLAILRLPILASSLEPESNAVSYRSERRQGWSGEWNSASMQDVISKLRDLK